MLKAKRPKTPKNTRIYAIGDVHGRLDLLNYLLSIIGNDPDGDTGVRKVLVMLGDYIDRGPDSCQVLDRLDEVKNGHILPDFKVHLLKGNHEDSMLSFLANKNSSLWLANGGMDTLASYGYKLNAKTNLKNLRKHFLKTLPVHHKKLLRSLKFSISIGDYGFVHAGVRPGVPWHNQDPNDLLWIRAGFLDSTEDFGHMVIHGHSPNHKPVQHRNRIGIDTKAWETGKLTCLVLEGKSQRFIST